MIYAAIDPGAVNAAIAVFSDATPLFVDDIRTTNGMIDSVAFAKALHDMRISRVVAENVHAMPRQGLSSTFKFGMSYELGLRENRSFDMENPRVLRPGFETPG